MSWNHFNAPNLGLLVYKRLYTEQSIKEKIKFDNDNQKLVINISKEAKDTPFDDFYKSVFEKRLTGYVQIENPAAHQKFTLFTTYPGLLAGTGYTHDSNAKGDIKIGFFFDHTTGQPIIPGSSIKGVLKSIFEDDNDTTTQSALDAWKFIINEIIAEAKENEQQGWQTILAHFKNNESGIKVLKDLKLNIFGTQDKEGDDVFFDAVINIEKSGSNNKFMASDFITPHQSNLLKNPTPLMFLKVLPNIAFEFRFSFTEFEKDGLKISAKQKEILFQKILLTLGIGAKTNVGYGQFNKAPIICNQSGKSAKKAEDEPKASTTQPGTHSSHQKKNTKSTSGNKGAHTDPQNNTKNNYTAPSNIATNHPAENTLKVGDPISATVAEIEDKNIRVVFHVAEKSKLKIPFPDKYATYKIGQELPLIVTVMNEGKIKGVKKQKN